MTRQPWRSCSRSASCHNGTPGRARPEWIERPIRAQRTASRSRTSVLAVSSSTTSRSIAASVRRKRKTHRSTGRAERLLDSDRVGRSLQAVALEGPIEVVVPRRGVGLVVDHRETIGAVDEQVDEALEHVSTDRRAHIQLAPVAAVRDRAAHDGRVERGSREPLDLGVTIGHPLGPRLGSGQIGEPGARCQVDRLQHGVHRAARRQCRPDLGATGARRGRRRRCPRPVQPARPARPARLKARRAAQARTRRRLPRRRAWRRWWRRGCGGRRPARARVRARRPMPGVRRPTRSGR